MPAHPAVAYGEGSLHTALMMDFDVPNSLGEGKCPGLRPGQAPTLQHRGQMYPVMRESYEKPPWDLCDRRGLLALDCGTDAHWDDITGRYGP